MRKRTIHNALKQRKETEDGREKSSDASRDEEDENARSFDSHSQRREEKDKKRVSVCKTGRVSMVARGRARERGERCARNGRAHEETTETSQREKIERGVPSRSISRHRGRFLAIER